MNTKRRNIAVKEFDLFLNVCFGESCMYCVFGLKCCFFCNRFDFWNNVEKTAFDASFSGKNIVGVGSVSCVSVFMSLFQER